MKGNKKLKNQGSEITGAYRFDRMELAGSFGDLGTILPLVFDDKADELIDELIGILFSQNMKSMEMYYKWVSRLYVETFGKNAHGPGEFDFQV